ncbi:MAG: hypothetical protein QNJ45_11315 [Ardenticatenaceae bacterium]|nr:hypothetical protein [Ardenticatenaceae bacterium]
MIKNSRGSLLTLTGLLLFILLLTGCQSGITPIAEARGELALPTMASAAAVPSMTPTSDLPPPTWTVVPSEVASGSFVGLPSATPRPPTTTPIPIPSRTPVTPTLTPSLTPTPSKTPVPVAPPFDQVGLNEPLMLGSYPKPPNDNGWGIHWMPTVSQDRGTVDRFVAEVKKMNIKWVVFLNDNTQIGDNDYLVEQLVANDIMPVMRLYRDSVLSYDGELGPMVRHYRAKGVYYFQLYNEPNANVENNQGFANPNVYAVTWAAAARDVIKNGGLPGIGALSPGGEYNHLEFFRRTIKALKFNGDAHLLDRSWVSLHNYHGLRPKDDLGGFLMFREYDRIVQQELGRSLPIIGTEGGSYHEDPQVVIDLLSWQYRYMRDREPYYFAFSHWLLANRAGGGWDETWEWQTLFRPGWTHPVVTEFFYKNRE